ncbi:hypothetical protein, partial [Kytococcus sp. HMSC28H12]|uniref:hypothetical protein n=1 Tax=Kytococcus sp. HMSC28H12 TaxID=1581067 RepID=UPI00114CCAC5
MRGWGKVLTTMGAIGVLVAVLLMVVGAVGMSGATDAAATRRPVATAEAVQLQQGDHHLLLGPQGGPSERCSVVGPDGAAVPVGWQSYDSRVVAADVRPRGSFTVERSGAHRVDCAGTAWMSDAIPMGSTALGLGSSAVGALLGLGAVVVLVTGAVLWLAGRDAVLRGGLWGPGG